MKRTPQRYLKQRTPLPATKLYDVLKKIFTNVLGVGFSLHTHLPQEEIPTTEGEAMLTTREVMFMEAN